MNKILKLIRNYWLILIILLVAAGLRFYKIDQSPAGFNADEAAIGYNVLCLLTTGRDEHGNSWPIHFQSFNDYKPGGYFYLVLPWVRLLGLSEIAVRLPSLILGVAGVWGAYLLTNVLFRLPKIKGWLSVGHLAALMVAVSPWQIHFSRGAWESNVASVLLVWGIYFFLVADHRARNYFVGLVLLVFSAYTYHSLRIIAPLLLLFLFLSRRKFFFSHKKIWLSLIIFGLLLSLPLLKDMVKGGAVSRFNGVGLVADVGPLWSSNRLRGEHGLENANQPFIRLFHNRPFGYLFKLAANWTSHYSGEFLFLAGDRIERSNAPDVGELYYLDLFWLILAFVFWIKYRDGGGKLLFFWLIIGPLPAALTFQSPHALRSLNMVYPLLILSAYGCYRFLTVLVALRYRIVSVCLILLIALTGLWNLAYFLNQYFTVYPQKYPRAWEYGFKQIADYIKPDYLKYPKIYFTDAYDQPYILLAFYLQYPCAQFQQESNLTLRDKFSFSTIDRFANFQFGPIDLNRQQFIPGSLIIGTGGISAADNIIYHVDYPNNSPAFRVVRR